MNYCRKCQSDYEKPGTCNCFAPQQATPAFVPYVPYYPWTVTPYRPWWVPTTLTPYTGPTTTITWASTGQMEGNTHYVAYNDAMRFAGGGSFTATPCS